MRARLLAVAAIALWAGLTLLLSRVRWLSRQSLAERLRPYQPGAAPAPRPAAAGFSMDSFQAIVAPVAAEIGARTARLFGVEEDLATRLRRVHSPLEAVEFRVRQIGWSVAAGVAATLAAMGLRLPGLLVLAAIAGTPLLVFLIIEQRLATASARWQQRLFLELPVVCEQIGMLLASGHSLGSALNRIAARGTGACATDLKQVTNRVRQGLTEIDALREWASLAAVPELRQVVHVLALNRATADLGTLMSREAR